ncbi:Adenylyl-sulfate kinase [Sodalis praecaptivus]
MAADAGLPLNENVVWHPHPVTRQDREALHKHQGAVLWFTGLSGSGKSTLAGALEQALHQRGVSTYLLDGDNVRHGLCRDLGFSDDDRRKNIRRVGEVARLMVDAGLIVLTAFISPIAPSGSWCAICCPPAALSKCLSIRRWPFARRAIRKGYTKKPAPASCVISPVSTRCTRRRSGRICIWTANNW